MKPERPRGPDPVAGTLDSTLGEMGAVGGFCTVAGGEPDLT